MSADLPPLGSRWGDLSTEQRRALPVETVLRRGDGMSVYDIRKLRRRWLDADNIPVRTREISKARTILSYPEAPCGLSPLARNPDDAP